jgi:hypothetical protein
VELLAILGLAAVLVSAGAAMAIALIMLGRPRTDCVNFELRGWLMCEAAALAETPRADRPAFERRLRSRVPPGLRLRYDEHVVEPAGAIEDQIAIGS